MPLIAWRKLQAGLGGAEKDAAVVVKHTEQVATGAGSFATFDNISLNKLMVKKVLRIPIDEDTYE